MFPGDASSVCGAGCASFNDDFTDDSEAEPLILGISGTTDAGNECAVYFVV